MGSIERRGMGRRTNWRARREPTASGAQGVGRERPRRSGGGVRQGAEFAGRGEVDWDGRRVWVWVGGLGWGVMLPQYAGSSSYA
jgi:hypothetical protein